MSSKVKRKRERKGLEKERREKKRVREVNKGEGKQGRG